MGIPERMGGNSYRVPETPRETASPLHPPPFPVRSPLCTIPRPSLDRETGTDIYSLSVVSSDLQGEGRVTGWRPPRELLYYRITDFGRFSRDGYSWPLRPFPSSGVSIRSGGVLYRGEGFHTLRGNFRLYYLHPFGIRIKEETASGNYCITVLPISGGSLDGRPGDPSSIPSERGDPSETG